MKFSYNYRQTTTAPINVTYDWLHVAYINCLNFNNCQYKVAQKNRKTFCRILLIHVKCFIKIKIKKYILLFIGKIYLILSLKVIK